MMRKCRGTELACMKAETRHLGACQEILHMLSCVGNVMCSFVVCVGVCVTDIFLLQKLNKMCKSSYQELHQRINRFNDLKRVAQKMKTQKDLVVRREFVFESICLVVIFLLLQRGEKCKRISGNDKTPVTYKWQKERKK